MAVDETVVAFHEAGHAVAASYNELLYEYVSIIPDDEGTVGRVLLVPDPDEPRPDLGDLTDDERLVIERKIITYFAGTIAEAKYCGIQPEFNEDYRQDWENVSDYADRVCASPEEAKAFERYLFYRTINLFDIAGQWKKVEALAAELVKQKKIDYQDSRKIMRDALGIPQIMKVDGKIVIPPFKKTQIDSRE